jgi:hypothetical protein
MRSFYLLKDKSERKVDGFAKEENEMVTLIGGWQGVRESI